MSKDKQPNPPQQEAQPEAPAVPVKGKNGQTILPPSPTTATPAQVSVERAEQELREAGWVEAYRNEHGASFWNDPAGMGDRRGEMEQTVKLAGKDGTDPTFVTQRVCPPASWTLPLSEALNVQRQRDTAPRKVVA